MKKVLWWMSIVAAFFALIIGIAGSDMNASGIPSANPLGGVAMAAAAFVFLKASEGLKE